MCPRCQCEESEVIKTIRKDGKIVRKRYCEQCDLIFKTTEIVTQVSVYHPNTMKSEFIELSIYEKRLCNG